ncbi:hypothetical protein [Halocella sp. SP3-1]|uniref:hypothetical protein n=1 Tax=Halocella sp. SP3-1 TaxID=2382161 RepID=UPI0013DE9BD8|nr:hypothetical protein [Halocella sp. SP3-1]
MKDKKNTFCNDCCKDPETCGEDPLDCMKEKDAELYFDLYDNARMSDFTSTKGVVA